MLGEMERAALKNFRREDGFLFTRKTTLYVDVLDRELLIKSIEDDGRETDFLKREFETARLRTEMLERMDRGEALYEGMGSKPKTYLSKTKS